MKKPPSKLGITDTKQALGLATETSIAHHIKGLRPALSVLEGLGYSSTQCLKGTGISLAQLEQSDQGITLQQELAFYRRALLLTENKHLGLALGKAYRLENYGMLGYAILSAQTLGEALKTAREFSPLSFSHFELDFIRDQHQASIVMKLNKALDHELLTLYEDRDCTAIIHGAMNALGRNFALISVELMHDTAEDDALYEAHFQCPVSFKAKQMRITFASEILSLPMPLRDPDTAAHCRQQCQKLLEQISRKTSLSSQITALFQQSSHDLPDLSEICNTLGVPERTMRRRLLEEHTNFQTLLHTHRFEQAKQLLQRDLSLSEIAHMLGYSEAGNFSHAFKRWSGVSPKTFRENLINGSPDN